MKALLKDSFRSKKEFAGKWVEIDTSCLFNDQYNTTEADGNMRIFDSDVVKIEDDARIGKGRCAYCGAIVELGKEEEHFKSEESKPCDGCFWYQRKYDDSHTEESDNGSVIVKTTTTLYHRECCYGSSSGCHTTCTNKEHRAMGINWFTPNNTYFLRHPLGAFSIRFSFAGPNNINNDWEVNSSMQEIKYRKKLGSYTLTAKIYNFDGISGCIEYFRISNGNTNIRFMYDSANDEFIAYNGINNSPVMRKHILDMKYAISSTVESNIKDLVRNL